MIDGLVLIAPNGRAFLAIQCQELHVYLYVMARSLLWVPMRVPGAPPYAPRKLVHAVTIAGTIRRRVGRLDVVVALEMPDDPDRSHVIGPTQVQDLLDDFTRRLVRMVMRAAFAAVQPLVAELAISVSLDIEPGSCDPRISACLVDVSDSLGVLLDSLLALNLSLISGHLDLLGHHP
jgi:hypothetical protein